MNAYDEMLKKDPIKLAKELEEECLVQIPQAVVTIEDMNEASRLMLHLSASFAYLNMLSSYAKIRTRELKRAGNKEEYEKMIDRKDVILAVTDATKQLYSGLSRSVTIKIEGNHELSMMAHN